MMRVTNETALLKNFPVKTAISWQALPLRLLENGSIEVALTDTSDQELLMNLAVVLGHPVQPVIRPLNGLIHEIREAYGQGAESLDQIQSIIHEPESEQAVVDETAMVKFVNDLIRRAYGEGATDIHIEPFEGKVSIRYRVDGLLKPIVVPSHLHRYIALLTARIKVMAQMNVAEKRLPQDGRIRFVDEGAVFDIRVSTIPVAEGESINLRLLVQKHKTLGLTDLGISEDALGILRKHIQKPSGLILVTGPTGHGKTTTLYACLAEINRPEKKIITIEDPIEYRLAGVNQIQVHTKIGLTFAQGLRSVLRQDPDVIMVGEIRDLETAEIAIRAALTGHLVLSTLHTTDAAGAIVRLIDMGIEPHLLVSSLNLVLAQRLVRTTCSVCRDDSKNRCHQCHGSGLHGRSGLFEIMPVSESLHSLIMRRANASEIREQVVTSGMRTLQVEGKRLVESGISTPSEILRVVEEVQ